MSKKSCIVFYIHKQSNHSVYYFLFVFRKILFFLLLKHILDLISVLMSLFCKFVTIWVSFVTCKKISVRLGLEFSETWILIVFIVFTSAANISVVLWICQNSGKLVLKLFNSSLWEVYRMFVWIVFTSTLPSFFDFSLFGLVVLVVWRLSLSVLHLF